VVECAGLEHLAVLRLLARRAALAELRLLEDRQRGPVAGRRANRLTPRRLLTAKGLVTGARPSVAWCDAIKRRRVGEAERWVRWAGPAARPHRQGPDAAPSSARRLFATFLDTLRAPR
jgi:hypothetical protein